MAVVMVGRFGSEMPRIVCDWCKGVIARRLQGWMVWRTDDDGLPADAPLLFVHTTCIEPYCTTHAIGQVVMTANLDYFAPFDDERIIPAALDPSAPFAGW